MLHATPPRGAHPSAWPRRSRRDLDEGPATHLLDLPPGSRRTRRSPSANGRASTWFDVDHARTSATIVRQTTSPPKPPTVRPEAKASTVAAAPTSTVRCSTRRRRTSPAEIAIAIPMPTAIAPRRQSSPAASATSGAVPTHGPTHGTVIQSAIQAPTTTAPGTSSHAAASAEIGHTTMARSRTLRTYPPPRATRSAANALTSARPLRGQRSTTRSSMPARTRLEERREDHDEEQIDHASTDAGSVGFTGHHTGREAGEDLLDARSRVERIGDAVGKGSRPERVETRCELVRQPLGLARQPAHEQHGHRDRSGDGEHGRQRRRETRRDAASEAHADGCGQQRHGTGEQRESDDVVESPHHAGDDDADEHQQDDPDEIPPRIACDHRR